MGLIKGGGLKQFRGILYPNMGDFGRFYAKFSDLNGVKTLIWVCIGICEQRGVRGLHPHRISQLWDPPGGEK